MYPEFDVCPTNSIAYLLMRKCGCSSLRHAMSGIRDDVQIKADQIELHEGQKSFCYHAKELPDPQSWFKFTLVRDPVSRFLSFYSTKILNQNVGGNHTFQNFDRFGLLPNMTMDQVIDVLCDPAKETEPHALPQSTYLDSVGYELDFIGSVEELDQSLNKIQQLTGVLLRPTVLNKSRQRHVLPTKVQFDRLVRHYRRDIDAFGYPDDYESWCRTFVVGREEKFQLEAGFTFEDEAKLLDHQIVSSNQGFEIQLKWRINPAHRRQRHIRVGTEHGGKLKVLVHFEPRSDLKQQCDHNGIVSEKIVVPFDQMPANVPLRDLYQQVYFCDRQRSRAQLTDYEAHENMLLFGFGHLESHEDAAKAA